MDLDAARKELAATCRALAAEGLAAGTSGNLSVRAGEHVLLTPTSVNLGRIEPEQIPLVDLDGNVLDGELAPSSELLLHLGAYKRFDTGAVVHTHAPMATAIACALQELPTIHYLMADFGGSVRVAPYLLFGTQELADAVHDALEDRTVVLMGNHGTLAIADDIATAAERTRLLEWVATLYRRTCQIGAPRLLSEDEIAATAAEIERRAYGKPKAN